MRIEENVSLKSFNTFGIEETSAYYCKVETQEHLRLALAFAAERKIEFLILGSGSNILITKRFSGIVIHVQNHGIEVLSEDEGQIAVRVAAGENWHNWVMTSLKNGWFGLENLSLIPGSVGAAPIQNIGAYGVEVKQFIRGITWYDMDAGFIRHSLASDCNFGYRDSIFKHELKGKALIWAVEFVLQKSASPKTEYGDIRKILDEKGITEPRPTDIAEAVISIRRSKLPDPAQIGNAGSFFKNPVLEQADFEQIRLQYPEIPSYPAGPGSVKIPAGWLIEKAGWKGKRLGCFGVHDRQALVLVNYGGATGSQIVQLSKDIREDVYEMFGVNLQAEVNMV
jgi:UDP-N-acetylmuramate dehydrogenase